MSLLRVSRFPNLWLRRRKYADSAWGAHFVLFFTLQRCRISDAHDVIFQENPVSLSGFLAGVVYTGVAAAGVRYGAGPRTLCEHAASLSFAG